MAENRVKPFADVAVPTNLEYLNPLDPENPRSLINLATPRLREAIESLPTKYFKLSETDLRAKAKPSAELCRLRINFWDEYLRAQDSGDTISVDNICRGVCANRYFYETVLDDEAKVAFLIIAPVDYQLAMRELLDLGWMKLREVLDKPITRLVPVMDGKTVCRDESGQIMMQEELNVRLITEIRHITAMLDQRVKGAIVQRHMVHQKNLNVNVAAPSSTLAGEMSLAQLEEMEKKLLGVKSLMDKELSGVGSGSGKEVDYVEAEIDCAEDQPAKAAD